MDPVRRPLFVHQNRGPGLSTCLLDGPAPVNGQSNAEILGQNWHSPGPCAVVAQHFAQQHGHHEKAHRVQGRLLEGIEGVFLKC